MQHSYINVPGISLIIDKVTGQKPVVGMDVGFAANQSQAIASAVRIELRDAMCRWQHFTGEPAWIVQIEILEVSAKR